MKTIDSPPYIQVDAEMVARIPAQARPVIRRMSRAVNRYKLYPASLTDREDCSSILLWQESNTKTNFSLGTEISRIGQPTTGAEEWFDSEGRMLPCLS
jgi:hypothetical protein